MTGSHREYWMCRNMFHTKLNGTLYYKGLEGFLVFFLLAESELDYKGGRILLFSNAEASRQ